MPELEQDGSEPQDIDFAELEALLEEETATPSPLPAVDLTTEARNLSKIAPDDALSDFADLDALLAEDDLVTAAQPLTPLTAGQKGVDSEFEDLEKLLEDNDKGMASPTLATTSQVQIPPQVKPRVNPRMSGGLGEQTMRVPVKHLDSLSNLVGELVVNRNGLEQNQERLRQFLDNLLYQVQQLGDVSQQMQELYERSLLEGSLLTTTSSPQTSMVLNASSSRGVLLEESRSSAGIQFDALQMDRFTGFHSLSQAIIERIVRLREAGADIEFVIDETDQVTRTLRQATTQIQEGLTQSRMVPFSQIADRLPRAVRDLTLKCGKRATLEIEGGETLVDKGLLEKLYDPMTHLVNNTIAHGIELPEVRQAAGKPEVGRIVVRAFYQGNQTIISVSDDGAGIDAERVKAKAIEKGLISPDEADSMSQLETYSLLFRAGFSTKDQADDLAGRGVGMDVVRASLDEIRGAIITDSSLGKGTTFTIRLPLTLSITKALCCVNEHCQIAFPIDGVEDVLDVPKDQIQVDADDQSVVRWRESLVPFRPLSELLTYSRYLGRGIVYGGNQDDSIIPIVVLRSADSVAALQVDQVLGEQEIVIKQLEGPVPKPTGVTGVTVLGDGRLMAIADVLELVDLSLGKLEVGGALWNNRMAPEEPAIKTAPLVLIVDDSITVRELLSMTFTKVGYRVEQARDGQEAWEKLRAGMPCDLMFCDIEMPKMDGLELLSRIQKDPTLNHLPIAMLTSRAGNPHRQIAIDLGARGYFAKPYLEEAMLNAAKRLLNGEVLVAKNVE